MLSLPDSDAELRTLGAHAGLVSGDISSSGADIPVEGDQAVPTGRQPEPFPEGPQGPKWRDNPACCGSRPRSPSGYTGADPDELARAHRRGQGRARRPRLHPRPPLPARRGHAVGRRPRRLVPAVGARAAAPRGRVHRVLRRALHGRVGRRAHRRPPAGDPPRPQRRLLDGRHGRHRRGRGGVGGARRRHRHRPRSCRSPT